MEGANGVMIVTTKDGTGNKSIAAIGVLPVTTMGLYKARSFSAAAAGPIVYWNPEITTDKDGNASLSFLNADHAGNFRIIVEGIDNSGNIGRLIYRYKVE
jgi:hypothetical protein